MGLSARLAVTVEFFAENYRAIAPEIQRRADEFFDGDEYEIGWIDVTLTELGYIKVAANVYLPEEAA